MSYDPQRHHRRSIRLKDFDYATPGAYVVTICVQNRIPFLGSVHQGRMQRSPAGEMVQTIWDELPDNYPGLETDAFVVMPNHVHGIIVLMTDSEGIDPAPGGERRNGRGQATQLTLPDVVHRFKSLTTNRYGKGVRELGWPPYDGRLWLRNYFERVIRNERELNGLREYIEGNPASWHDDKQNPDYVPLE